MELKAPTAKTVSTKVYPIDPRPKTQTDTAGNTIARFGRWGNAQTKPGPDGNARDLGFRLIYCVTTSGDHVYVSDKDLRRIAQVKMDYRVSRETAIPREDPRSSR